MPAAALTPDNLMALSLTAVTLIGVLAVYSSRITPSTEVYLTAVTAFMIASAPAFALCGENRLPMVIFGMEPEGNILRVVRGERIGTLVSA